MFAITKESLTFCDCEEKEIGKKKQKAKKRIRVTRKDTAH